MDASNPYEPPRVIVTNPPAPGRSWQAFCAARLSDWTIVGMVANAVIVIFYLVQGTEEASSLPAERWSWLHLLLLVPVAITLCAMPVITVRAAHALEDDTPYGWTGLGLVLGIIPVTIAWPITCPLAAVLWWMQRREAKLSGA